MLPGGDGKPPQQHTSLFICLFKRRKSHDEVDACGVLTDALDPDAAGKTPKLLMNIQHVCCGDRTAKNAHS
eukprot:202320-Heterocapsa_arctica.AAC.1